ncbi:MAG: BolA family protein [Pseudomonadota bacterium]
MTERVEAITARLTTSLEPTALQVRDQSHLHAGHAGAKDGRGHFAVDIVSSAFEGASRIERHRMIYESLGTLMDTDIHALSIRARTPSEDSN